MVAGAVNECSTDAYISTGVTNTLHTMEYARKNSPLIINLHHLEMSCDDTVMPCVEFPMSEDVPRGMSPAHPFWPRIGRSSTFSVLKLLTAHMMSDISALST
jgi:hypothetical protein